MKKELSKTEVVVSPVILNIPAIDKRYVSVVVVGVTPLICNRFTEKARKGIEDKQQKKASKGKEARNPQAEYEASQYKHDGKHVFPAIAFKRALMSTGEVVGEYQSTIAKSFHVVGDWVEIQKSQPQFRQDQGRLQGRTAMPVYRAEYPLPWRMEVLVSYNANFVSPEQIFNLFNLAGFHVGIGAWRPEKKGTFGQFEVETQK